LVEALLQSDATVKSAVLIVMLTAPFAAPPAPNCCCAAGVPERVAQSATVSPTRQTHAETAVTSWPFVTRFVFTWI
jgi:hypothetical protein